MASISRRRNRDGSSSWDASVRITGHPAICKSFPSKLEAELWASRIEAAVRGRTLALARDMTVAQFIDDAPSGEAGFRRLRLLASSNG